MPLAPIIPAATSFDARRRRRPVISRLIRAATAHCLLRDDSFIEQLPGRHAWPSRRASRRSSRLGANSSGTI